MVMQNAKLKTKCIFCSLGCEVIFNTERGKILSIDYQKPICPRGNYMLENYPDINTLTPPKEEIEAAQILADLPISKKAAQVDLESADTLLIIGDVLARASVLSCQLNKVKSGSRANKIILIDSKKSKTSWFATSEFIVLPETEASIIEKTMKDIKESKNPVIVFTPSFAKIRNDLIAQAIKKIISIKGKVLVVYSLPEEIIVRCPRAEAPCGLKVPRKEEGYPFLLIFEDDIVHWMDGSISRKFSWAKINCPIPYLKIHPTDAEKIGIKNKNKIKVSSKENEAVLEVRISEEVREGVVCAPHHFPEIRKFGKLTRVLCKKESI